MASSCGGLGNDAVISNDATSVLVDGAKRDRTIWPGDLGVSQPTAFVSTDDTASARNVLNILYGEQDGNGGLPYCGPPVNCGTVSDTYHLWTLIASGDYYVDTRDKEWLDSHWTQYKAGIQFSLNKIDGSGLLSVSLPADWGRIVPLGGENLSPNVLLYRALTSGAYLAQYENDPATTQEYLSLAANLKHAVNALLWDEAVGEYRDSPSVALYPQDGNALAVWFGIVDSSERASSVSSRLRLNWNTYGALTPERPNAIATFPGSMEVMSHFAAYDDQSGLDLIRREWGYMLNSAIGTNSTFWEGYLSDGTFDYEGSSMSKAHGWATGPTSALTYYVLGIMPGRKADLDYSLVPHPGDLSHVRGRLTLANGTIDVEWSRPSNTGSFDMKINTSSQLVGQVGIPTFGRQVRVLMDGLLLWDGCSSPPMGSTYNSTEISSNSRYVYIEGLKGSHAIHSLSCGV